MILRLLIFIFIVSLSSLEAQKLGEKQRIIVSQITEDEYRMRIYLNYENPFETFINLTEVKNKLTVNLPTPDRFLITKMRKFLVYKTGLGVSASKSYLLDLVNDNVVFQTPLISKVGAGELETIQYNIPINKLYEGYNKHTIYINQKTDLKGIESQMWTQLYTEDSYIEYDFRLKPFDEKLSSIYKFIADNKLMLDSKINLVFPEIPTESDMNNYGFLANILGYIIEFRDIKFSVSTQIDNDFNNIIVMNREKVKTLLANYSKTTSNFDYKNKILGTINVIKNPVQSSHGILIITGDSEQEVQSGLIKLTDSDIARNKEQSIISKDLVKPKKAKPFMSPKLIQFGRDVTFDSKSLFNVRNNSNTRISTYEAQFLMYPILDKLSSNTFHTIQTNINYSSINSPELKSVLNIYINGVLAKHSTLKSMNSKASLGYSSEINNINLEFLKNGLNNLKVEIKTYPHKTGSNLNIIGSKIKILGSSFINISKVPLKIRYPNLQYISEMAFPFSTYSDLQNTGILITDFNADTIASAMQVAFKLGKKINFPAYYLTTTYDINSILDKDIIVVGNQIKDYAPLFKQAPIRIDGNRLTKDKYIKQIDTILTTTEFVNLDNSILVQTYKSIFNPKRIILEISANNPATLLKGIQKGFQDKSLGNFKGDYWVYNIKLKKGVSEQLQKSYIVKDLVEDFQNNYQGTKYKNLKEF